MEELISDASRPRCAKPINGDALSLEQAAAIARAWSLVHGFTMLLLDGRLTDILRRLPRGTDAATLLDAMLKSTVGRPRP